jgi:hypothetical protein
MSNAKANPKEKEAIPRFGPTTFYDLFGEVSDFHDISKVITREQLRNER